MTLKLKHLVTESQPRAMSPEPARRLAALHAEIARAARELRMWRARATSFELAVTIEGDSLELRQRRALASAHAVSLARWLESMQRAERALNAQLAPQEERSA